MTWPTRNPRTFVFPDLYCSTGPGLFSRTFLAVSSRRPVSFTVFSPCSSTYASGSTSSAKICSNTSFATWLLTDPASASSIRDARCFGENCRSSGSCPFSFKRRKVSPISQFATFFGLPQSAVVSSKRSESFLEPVRMPASYCGSPYCST